MSRNRGMGFSNKLMEARKSQMSFGRILYSFENFKNNN